MIASREKIYGMPQSYPLDREQKARIKWYARSWSEAHCEPGQHKGPITRAFMEVLWALLDFANSKTGSCFPSYEAIADKAGCHRDTVRKAVGVLELAGVLRVVNRLVHDGKRVLRTSNAYVFRAIGPKPEIPAGTQTLKDSTLSSVARAPQVILVSPKMSMIDAVLARFGITTGVL